jgi:hypothetical protein
MVNLGDAPVSIGSDSKLCAVWLPRAQPIDCTFTLRGQELTFRDRLINQESRSNREDSIALFRLRRNGGYGT